MRGKIQKSCILFMVLLLCFSSINVSAKNGFTKKPTSKVGFKPDKKTNGKKVKDANGRDYGWKDNKGRVWVPDGAMHEGQGWTR